MVMIKFHFLLLITILNVSHCQRRIVDGEEVTSEKSYVQVKISTCVHQTDEAYENWQTLETIELTQLSNLQNLPINVYLIKAPISDRTYDSWLCGGALVTRHFILTSAACVEDVHYMYAIAGYRKYVTDKNLEADDCTKEMKKKIVYTCIPVSYEFDFDQIEKWAYIDIALVKVESPYDFDDARYQLMCSYVPSTIPINYDIKRQATNVDAMVLGWGHTDYWRQHGDVVNYNQDYLRFGSTTLYDKKKCQQEYSDYPDLTKIIEKYMICSMEPGHLNDHGVPYSANQKVVSGGCITMQQKSKGMQGQLCKVEQLSKQLEPAEQALMYQLVPDGDETRKRMSLNEKSKDLSKDNINGTGFVKGTGNDNVPDIANRSDIVNGTDIVNRTDIANAIDIVNITDILNGTDIANGTDSVKGTLTVNRTNTFEGTDFIYKPGFGNISGYFNRTFTRRNGICQNDHGGPIVTWVGKREVLIGIASVFKITEENKCIGPFLYTSTMCNGAFIGCLLGDRRANVLRGKDMSVSTSQALFCDSPPSVKGFDTIESYVSWKDHPDGPADNEKHMRGRLVPNQKKDRYATNVKEDSEEDVNPLNDINTQHKIHSNIRPKKPEKDTNDRFSLRIGLPPGMRLPPRKRPPIKRKKPSTTKLPPSNPEPPLIGGDLEMEPSPINSPPPELAPSPISTFPLKSVRPPIIRPPSNMGPSPIIRPPQEMGYSTIIKDQTKMRVTQPPEPDPAFEEILNFNSNEVFLKKNVGKPSLKANKPGYVLEPEILIRPQSSLRG